MCSLQPSIQDGIDSWCREESVLAFDVTRRLLFEIAAVVLCGFDRREIEGEVMATTFMDFTKGFFTLPFDLPGTPYRKVSFIMELLLRKCFHGFMQGVQTLESPEIFF